VHGWESLRRQECFRFCHPKQHRFSRIAATLTAGKLAIALLTLNDLATFRDVSIARALKPFHPTSTSFFHTVRSNWGHLSETLLGHRFAFFLLHSFPSYVCVDSYFSTHGDNVIS